MKSKLINLMAVLLISGTVLIHSKNNETVQTLQIEQIKEETSERISLKQVTWEAIKLYLGASLISRGTQAVLYKPSTLSVGIGLLSIYIGTKVTQDSVENIYNELQEIKKANQKAKLVNNMDLATNQ